MKMKFPIIKARDLSKHQNITDCYHDISIQINQTLAWEQILGPHCKTVQSIHELQSLLSIHGLSNHRLHQHMN